MLLVLLFMYRYTFVLFLSNIRQVTFVCWDSDSLPFRKKTHSTKQHKNSPRMNFFINNHGTIKTFYCAFRIQRYELSNQVSIHHYLVLQWQKSQKIAFIHSQNVLFKISYFSKYPIVFTDRSWMQRSLWVSSNSGHCMIL